MSEHELWNELGNLYFISGRLDQAAYAYNRSIDLETRFGMPYSNLAFVHVQRGDFKKAIDLYQYSIELLVSEQDKAVSWYRLGDVFRHLKNYRDAIMAYQQADMLDPETGKRIEDSVMFLYGPSGMSTDELLRAGGVTLENANDGDVAGAQGAEVPDTRNTQPVSKDAGDEPPLEDEGAVGQGWLEEEEDGNDLVQVETADDMEDLNYILENLEDAVDGTEGFDAEHIYWNNPDLGDPVMMPAENITSPNMYRGNDGKEILQITSPNVTASRDNAVVMQAEETDVEVLEQEAVFMVSSDDEMAPPVTLSEELPSQISPSLPETRLNVEPVDDAYHPSIELQISKLEHDVQKNPRSASKWNDLATLYKSAGMYKKAVPAYEQAVELDPQNPAYHHNLGITYAVEGRHEDAIKCMQMVIDLNPDHSLAHATLGGYYKKKGLKELAEQHIGIAVKNYIDDENQYNRACLEALCGNVDQAVEYLRAALEARQIYVEWVLRDPDLDGIRFTPQFKQLIAEHAQ